MGWWDDEDDILGDQPADMLSSAWRRLIATRKTEGKPLPLFDEVMDAQVMAIQKVFPTIGFTGLEVWEGKKMVQLFKGERRSPELEKEFKKAFEDISAEYQSNYERPVRPSELAKTQEFLWSYQPEKYIMDPEKISRKIWLKAV